MNPIPDVTHVQVTEQFDWITRKKSTNLSEKKQKKLFMLTNFDLQGHRKEVFQTKNHGYGDDNHITYKGDPSSTIEKSLDRLPFTQTLDQPQKNLPSDILAFLDRSLASSTSFVVLVSRITTDSHGELCRGTGRSTVQWAESLNQIWFHCMFVVPLNGAWGCLIHRYTANNISYQVYVHLYNNILYKASEGFKEQFKTTNIQCIIYTGCKYKWCWCSVRPWLTLLIRPKQTNQETNPNLF